MTERCRYDYAADIMQMIHAYVGSSPEAVDTRHLLEEARRGVDALTNIEYMIDGSGKVKIYKKKALSTSLEDFSQNFRKQEAKLEPLVEEMKKYKPQIKELKRFVEAIYAFEKLSSEMSMINGRLKQLTQRNLLVVDDEEEEDEH